MNPARIKTAPRHAARRGFSLTELIVVVGIIALLVGLLLVALGQVRSTALGAQTEASMNSFVQACEAFQIEHGQYPGIIPEVVLAEDNTISNQPKRLTPIENALIALMGGYRVLRPDSTQLEIDEFTSYADCSDGSTEFSVVCFDFGGTGWQLKVDLRRIGEGPFINGRQYDSYFDPGADEMKKAVGQVGDHIELSGGDVRGIMGLPDLVDAWGQPMIFVRRLRPVGNLLDVAPSGAQFTLVGTEAYLSSAELGELGLSQIDRSILSPNLANNIRVGNFLRLLEHPGFAGTPRGQILLISAGPDGVFFSAADGPGTGAAPVEDIGDPTVYPSSIVDEYDDLHVVAGG